MAVTLATLRTRARERADMPVAGFVPDSATGIDAFINEGVQRLHEKLVEAYDSKYLVSSSAFTCSGAETVALPADFYKLLGVDLNVSGVILTLESFAMGMRNVQRNALVTQPLADVTKYMLRGSNLVLSPAPASGVTGTIWYAPQATTLVLTSDSVSFPNGWERYVVLYTAIQMRMKQEDNVNDLRFELEKMERELQDIADRRDLARPAHAVDVEAISASNQPWWF